MPAQLVALSEGPNILLDKPILLVGRHQECDIQIPSRKISRRHCCIAQVDDHLVVRDLCSTNGIRINGIRVNEGNLKGGDELTIGNYRYQVDWSGQAAAPLVAAPAAPPVALPAPRTDLGPSLREHKHSLDSGEEPIALADPEPPPRPAFPGNGIAPQGFKDRPPSLHFPDNIRLAPLSDSQMRFPK